MLWEGHDIATGNDPAIADTQDATVLGDLCQAGSCDGASELCGVQLRAQARACRVGERDCVRLEAH